MRNNFNKYAWNDALILDKIQEILNEKNINDLDFSEEDLEIIKSQLNDRILAEDINQTAYIVAQNVDELKILPNEDVKDYIVRLKNYLNNTNVNVILAKFKGIEFEVHRNFNIEDIFKEYYKKYDKVYGISQMLSDLGLK